MLLWLSYAHGGLNGNGWFFGGGAKAPYNYIVTLLMSPPDINWLGWWVQGIGGAIMGLLMFLRSQFLMVAPPPNRICHWSNLADGSTLVYRFSRVVNQGVYPQIWKSWRLSKSTSLVSRFDLGAVYL